MPFFSEKFILFVTEIFTVFVIGVFTVICIGVFLGLKLRNILLIFGFIIGCIGTVDGNISRIRFISVISAAVITNIFCSVSCFFLFRSFPCSAMSSCCQNSCLLIPCVNS